MFRKTRKILMSEKLSNLRGVGKNVRGRLKAAIQNFFSYCKKLASIHIVWIFSWKIIQFQPSVYLIFYKVKVRFFQIILNKTVPQRQKVIYL